MSDNQRQAGRPSAWHGQLDRWLREWKCITELRPARARLPSRPSPSIAPQPGDEIKPGQIRLVAPDIPETFVMPLTLALLPTSEAGWWLAAPFSPLATPASPGELQLKRAPPLRVVSVDMATVLPSACVERSRWVDDLRPDEWRELNAVYESATTGRRTDAVPTARLGPPLWHPRDPRHRYVDWQAGRMDALARHASGPAFCYARTPSGPELEWARAAETRNPYRVADTLVVEGTPWILQVHPADNQGRRRVEARHSLQRTVIRDLDGGILTGADRVCAGQIKHGRAVVAADTFHRSDRLEMPDGATYRLRERSL